MSTSSGTRNYAIVTMAYWADTMADGAIRMLVLFYFYQLGYSALQVASLFLFYELFGILTNFAGGVLASRYGLKSTLFMGLGTQLLALGMLAFMPAAGLTVIWVMASQAMSGIAKDLTKMSSKSAVKLVAGDAEGRLYRWVALLTGSKNALKGVGFFIGSLLLSVMDFQSSVMVIMAVVALAMISAGLLMRGGLGDVRNKSKFSQLISRNRAVNMLSVARFFLFGARDVWFVVALPVFLSSVLGWKFWQAGGFMALWVIGYGCVQAAAPAILRGRDPTGKTAKRLAFILAAIPILMAIGLYVGWNATAVVVGGLIVFGVIFALNSAVHSFLILDYTDHDKIAMNVGIYYMANACGRLAGTVLSGLLYQLGMRQGGLAGMTWCLVASALFLIATGLISLALPKQQEKKSIA
ncbi:organoarsenical effux MFS transporter ArsJ [Luteolibacter sp. AS25]|uniref:organoarsenical effux MFS transporter ArsJ n=1 Tax=Luteolibacter sp. AS25 TaxID=3135776 RepID=UPI00398B01EB